MSTGPRIKAGLGHRDAPVAPDVIERLSRASSGSLTTELFRRGLKQCFLVGLKPMNPNAARFAGEAYTMRFIPTREDIDTYATLTPYPNPDNLQWEAVENIGKGQVLVIDSRNDMSSASAGNVLATRMMVKGCAGLVTDGGLRDGREYAELPFPAYARGIVASTRLSTHHAADLQVPIACAGVAVYPGDIIVGDGDGITVVPRHMAAEIADACGKRDAFEAYLVQRIASGEGLYGVYPPTDKIRADYAAWVEAGSRPEDISKIRAET
jgi:regulator of RNase E activity RraA